MLRAIEGSLSCTVWPQFESDWYIENTHYLLTGLINGPSFANMLRAWTFEKKTLVFCALSFQIVVLEICMIVDSHLLSIHALEAMLFFQKCSLDFI